MKEKNERYIVDNGDGTITCYDNSMVGKTYKDKEGNEVVYLSGSEFTMSKVAYNNGASVFMDKIKRFNAK